MEALARAWDDPPPYPLGVAPPARDPDGPVEVVGATPLPVAHVYVNGEAAGVPGFAQRAQGHDAYRPTVVCPWCAQGHAFDACKVEVAVVEDPVLPAYNGGTYHEGCYELLRTMGVL